MKRCVLCLMSVVLFLAVNGCRQNTDHKQNLRVLYVGIDPGKRLPPMNFAHGAGIAESRYEEDMRGRMPAFEKLLKSHFVKVGTVDARDYREEMTGDYDVIIFDAVPEAVVPGKKSTKTNSLNLDLLSESVRKKLENVVDTKELFSAVISRISIVNRLCSWGIKLGFLGRLWG